MPLWLRYSRYRTKAHSAIGTSPLKAWTTGQRNDSHHEGHEEHEAGIYSRSPTADLHEIGRDEDRIFDELQRDRTERWNQTIHSLIPSCSSCSSCPSWSDALAVLDWMLWPYYIVGRGVKKGSGERLPASRVARSGAYANRLVSAWAFTSSRGWFRWL